MCASLWMALSIHIQSFVHVCLSLRLYPLVYSWLHTCLCCPCVLVSGTSFLWMHAQSFCMCVSQREPAYLQICICANGSICLLPIGSTVLEGLVVTHVGLVPGCPYMSVSVLWVHTSSVNRNTPVPNSQVCVLVGIHVCTCIGLCILCVCLWVCMSANTFVLVLCDGVVGSVPRLCVLHGRSEGTLPASPSGCSLPAAQTGPRSLALPQPNHL